MTRRNKPVAFCEHPLTADEKFELTSAGFKIVDIKFMPEKLNEGDKAFKKPKPKDKK